MNLRTLVIIFLILIVAAVIVAAVIYLPQVLIWSINILFDKTNPYDLEHWFAALLLITLLGGFARTSRSSRKE